MKHKPTPEPEPALSKGLRRYLYVTAACTGAAIMVVEILGAKMLSPYFGLSHFVWTAQIAVTLVGLAWGYYWGGRLADRWPRLGWLYWAILGAGGYLVVTVLVCEPVAYRCLDFNLAVGSLLASSVLFFVPLGLLAMTGPFLVRVMTSSVAGVGGNVGRLTSVGTLGSFGGTLGIGYVMIPLLPNSVTMYVTAAGLMAVSGGYFVVYGRKGRGPWFLAVVLAAAAGCGLYLGRGHQYEWLVEEYRGNSNFGRLQVLETRDGTSRLYLNDFLIQNTYDPERKQSESAFTYLLAGLGRAYTREVRDVLCIGLGVGIVPMDFARRGARVDVVEINPAVVPVAVRYFDLELDRIHLRIDDGRHYLNRCRKQYDVVVLDAFLGDSSPSHLLTREAFGSIRRVLRPGGTLVINAFGSLEDGRDFFAASLDKTLKAVFPGVRLHTDGQGAVFFAATDRAEPGFVHAPDLEDIHPEAQEEVQAVFGHVASPLAGHGRVLTDDYNPVEFFDARNREEFRRRLARGAREM